MFDYCKYKTDLGIIEGVIYGIKVSLPIVVMRVREYRKEDENDHLWCWWL